MEVITLNKPKKKSIDWISPHSETVTLEDYRNEMRVAENGDFISFENHKNNMNKWLKTKL
jgi:hypothetical protein